MSLLSRVPSRCVAALRALWDMLWSASAPLARSSDLARRQFDSEYDEQLVETAASLEPPSSVVRRTLRRVA